MTITDITGKTRLFGILADPIHQVKTPQVMNALFRRHAVDAVLVPMHVAPDGLPALMAGLREMRNFGGFIATVPHKPDMLSLCDETVGDAARIGAVNCVRRESDGRMVGAMLDGIGFVEGLRSNGIGIVGCSILLAGAGGAASAIAFALAGAGAGRLTICNRTVEKAEALSDRVRRDHPYLPVQAKAALSDIGEFDIIVNATSLGMRAGDPLPVGLKGLGPHHVVAEAIMEPAETPLLAEAVRHGCRVQPGLPMLERQIELMARHMGALA
ncbi:shikimate dehydrogenase family protein [Paracoccus alkanivorans]|uniref:shikimate dehydrogenase (NADP(+)) n=1 Tax=Paracoccus alkanivorans TaxID=2116655 RepID=A0A3M0MDH3_9RHOB|nr:shikimate dehydrogenase [Paracoccus alkanivorans]RMC35639.1 shikimate dehydrogenase [Paracoccus alkanivorans]